MQNSSIGVCIVLYGLIFRAHGKAHWLLDVEHTVMFFVFLCGVFFFVGGGKFFFSFLFLWGGDVVGGCF